MPKKIKLELNELTVNSFSTTKLAGGASGDIGDDHTDIPTDTVFSTVPSMARTEYQGCETRGCNGTPF